MKSMYYSSAIIVNGNNEVLLQKKDLNYKKGPGKWALFGGVIEPGETPYVAIKRELIEEIGINLEAKLFKVYDYMEKTITGRIHIYTALFDLPISSIKLGEGAGFAFYNKKELASLNLLDADNVALKEYFEL